MSDINLELFKNLEKRISELEENQFKLHEFSKFSDMNMKAHERAAETIQRLYEHVDKMATHLQRIAKRINVLEERFNKQEREFK